MSSRQSTPQFRRDRGISGMAFAVFALLLVVPGYALSRISPEFDWRVLSAAAVGMSALTYFSYRSDKRRAGASEWRIPESTLHLCEMLGGWPGAFLAQRKFRHKTAKASYQVTFWLIVALHQFVAVDSLLQWKLTNDFLRYLQS